MTTFVADVDGKDRARAIAVDKSSGDLFIAGETTGIIDGVGSEDDFRSTPMMARFSSDGELAWMRAYDEVRSAALDVALDSANGTVYMVGQTSSNTSAFLAATNMNGELQWSKDLTQFNYERASAVQCDPSSNRIYVAGSVSGDVGDHTFAGGGEDAVLSAFDLDGNLEWHASVGTEDREWTHRLELNTDSQPVIYGRNGKSSTNDDETVNSTGTFLARYTSDGEQTWIQRNGQQIPLLSAFYIGAYGLWIEPTTGEIYTVNSVDSDSSDALSYALERRSDAGEILESTQFGDAFIGIDLHVNGLAHVAARGTSYAVGSSDGSLWYAVIDSSGEVESDSTFAGELNNGAIYDVVYDEASGNVYMAGWYSGLGTEGEPPYLEETEQGDFQAVVFRLKP